RLPHRALTTAPPQIPDKARRPGASAASGRIRVWPSSLEVHKERNAAMSRAIQRHGDSDRVAESQANGPSILPRNPVAPYGAIVDEEADTGDSIIDGHVGNPVASERIDVVLVPTSKRL